eukprot:scaffold1333_cov130-Skeletonema_dohrnii-CCMP3373.AAC.16
MSVTMKHIFLLASLLVLLMSTDARKIRSSGLTSRHQHHHLHHSKSNAFPPDLYKLRGGEVDIDSTTTAAATHYQRTISTLHSTSFLIVLSTSIVAFTPLPSITRHLAASLSSASTSSPQEQAVKILSLISAASAAVELFLSPLLGTLLDRFGRKRPSVLLHSLITLTNLGVVMYPSVHTICISRIINVLCSGFLIITTQSIIGDLFSGNNQKDNNNGHGKDQMGAVLGRQAALISSGFLFGSLLGGRLTEYGERIAYSVAAIFSALAALNAAFRMTDTLDLTSSSSSSSVAAADESKALDWTSLKKALLEAPLSSIQLLFHYGSHMRTLALLLLLQSAPMYMGDVFQVFAKEEWGLKPTDFGKIVALFGVLGIVSNTTLSLIVKQMGLRTFSLFAIVSSLFFPMTAIFTNNYRNVLIAGSIGLYSGAQKVGTTTAITSLANERGIPQGQLQGEKASMLALLKIGCPVIYSALYLKGKEWNMSMNDTEGNKLALQMIMGKFGKKMPFVLNCILGVIAFIVTWQNM